MFPRTTQATAVLAGLKPTLKGKTIKFYIKVRLLRLLVISVFPYAYEV